MELPTFEDMRRCANRLLAEAEDELRSDWREGAGPNDRQAEAMNAARASIAQARNWLDYAARMRTDD